LRQQESLLSASVDSWADGQKVRICIIGISRCNEIWLTYALSRMFRFISREVGRTSTANTTTRAPWTC
jgi:hypothetical protein